MKNILKYQYRNLLDSLKAVELENERVILRSDLVKNIMHGKETYVYEDKTLNLVDNKWVRLDSKQIKSDNLGNLMVAW